MKLNKSVLLLALVASLVTPAFAERQGLYLGADLGRVRFVGNDEDPVLKHTSVGLIGGYDFNDRVAVEFGFHDFGRAHVIAVDGDQIAPATLKARNLSLAAIGAIPLCDKVALYGRLGFARNWAKLEVPVAQFAETDHLNGAELGLGVRVDLNAKLTLRAQYARYTKADANLFSLGVAVGF